LLFESGLLRLLPCLGKGFPKRVAGRDLSERPFVPEQLAVHQDVLQRHDDPGRVETRVRETAAMNILTANVLFSTFVVSIIARLYVLPRIGEWGPRVDLLPILILNAFRHLGLMFLAPGATYAGIPAEFAYPAAFGDLLAAVLAVSAIPAVAKGLPSARILVWIFNVEGSVDLINAIVLATVHPAAP